MIKIKYDKKIYSLNDKSKMLFGILNMIKKKYILWMIKIYSSNDKKYIF